MGRMNLERRSPLQCDSHHPRQVLTMTAACWVEKFPGSPCLVHVWQTGKHGLESEAECLLLGYQEDEIEIRA